MRIGNKCVVMLEYIYMYQVSVVYFVNLAVSVELQTGRITGCSWWDSDHYKVQWRKDHTAQDGRHVHADGHQSYPESTT